jgi:hypothetical protein
MLASNANTWPLGLSLTVTVTLNSPLLNVPLAAGSTRNSVVPGATSAHDGLPATKIGSLVVATAVEGLPASSTLSAKKLVATALIIALLRLFCILPPDTALFDAC